MLKNLTPRQIALYAAICIGAIVLPVAFFLAFTSITKWWAVVLACLVVIAGAYWINLFFLQKYIYRKIKLIYKSIHTLKLDRTQKTRTIDMDSSILEDVDKDVAEWAEDQEREISELKRLENYRREYIGNVSHELKTPIFNIQGYVHTLMDGALSDPQVSDKYLDRLAKNVERLTTIVDDLETISELESGKLLLDINAFDIRQLALDVFEAQEINARERGITLQLKDGASSGFIVSADIDYVRQVLDNLIRNSIKYGRDNGITKVAFYNMEQYILVEVADNGIGMGEVHLKHVFDRFYRVDKSRSRQVGGSGLGLSIVKHIIEAHNQTINVRSAPDVGSTFGFTLDRA